MGRLLIVGDAVHFANIQLPLPDVSVTYDSDPKQAAASRRTLFDTAVRDQLPIASMHMPFPGMGWLEQDGEGYLFKPLE